MNIRVALLAGAALLGLASTPALAQGNGFYTGLAGGANWLNESTVTGGGASNDVDFDLGYGLLAKLGYGFMDNFRTELELGYRSNDIDSTSAAGVNASGDVNAWTAFVNGYYDFMPKSQFNPFVGLGLGMARVNVDSARVNATRVIDDNDTVAAYQGIVGASYALADNWLLTADYRYTASFSDLDLRSTTGTKVEADWSNHAVMLGLTYRFGAPAKAMPAAAPAPMPVATPAPAPAPAAAPAPAPRAPETYIVFFAFDKSDISPVAAQVLDRAIADYRATGSTNVRIEGNADRSGKNDYNLKLSQRRASSVAAYLSSKGIAQNAIQTVANGEEKPRVPTADGVRNDENRNAQIYLRK
jgi:outer membrane protein OmpA-like peptidoglycan-associated protein